MIIVQICYIIQSTIITIPYIDIIVKFFLIGGMFMTNEKPITRKSKGSGSWDTKEKAKHMYGTEKNIQDKNHIKNSQENQKQRSQEK